MEPMTPEERFTKIESLLQTVSEHQATQQEAMDKNTAAIRDLIIVSRTVLESQKVTTAQVERTQSQIESMAAKIENMVVENEKVGTKVDQWFEKFNAAMDKLHEAQEATDEKLHILIDTVDRIIRNQKNDRNEPPVH